MCDLERKIPFTSQIRKRMESARKYFISNDDLEIGRFVFFPKFLSFSKSLLFTPLLHYSPCSAGSFRPFRGKEKSVRTRIHFTPHNL